MVGPQVTSQLLLRGDPAEEDELEVNELAGEERKVYPPANRRGWLADTRSVRQVGLIWSGALAFAGVIWLVRSCYLPSATFEDSRLARSQPAQFNDDTVDPAASAAAAQRKRQESAGEKESKLASAAAFKRLLDSKFSNGLLKKMMEHANGLKILAKAMEAKAEEAAAAAQEEQEEAEAQSKRGTALRNKAQALRVQLKEVFDRVTALEEKAEAEVAEAREKQEEAEHKLEEAARLQGQGKELESKSQKELEQAQATEAHGLAEVQARRVCIHLQNVKLEGRQPQHFEAVTETAEINTPKMCMAWCQAHMDCQQAVFEAKNASCELFGEATTNPLLFEVGYKSWYCGKVLEKYSLMDRLEEVFNKKKKTKELRNCSWVGEDCSHTKCCANVCAPDAGFQTCQWYTCYKKDNFYAGCKLGQAPDGWEGTKLGGHSTREVAQARPGTLVKGTKLFCFAVVLWSKEEEAALANHWRQQGRSVTQCDEHEVFDGLPTGVERNVDSFVRAWELVKQSGKWRNNDWTVKVDPDTVFFPERLKQRLRGLRTPQGAPVYVRNANFKFHFLGALEVMTREAVASYFGKAGECEAHVGKEAGEDYWLMSCLEGIGVDYQTDYQMLNDKHAGASNCSSDSVVAFHFYTNVDEWDACHTAAQRAASKGQAPPPGPPVAARAA